MLTVTSSRAARLVMIALLCTTALRVQAQIPAPTRADTLELYFLDTEGGQATLVVTPSRETARR